MLLARLPVWFLFVVLLSSIQVVAAPRYWTLAGLGFSDGSLGSGYFSYDDTTQTISSWNVQVDPAFGVVPGFVYVPANSTTSVIQFPAGAAPTLRFNATMGVPGRVSAARELQITPLAALDGSSSTVLLATSSREDFRSLSVETPIFRVVRVGSLTLTTVLPSTAIVQVDEFYHPGLRHYFITANAAEKQSLDTGVVSGWQRTGESFKAYARGSNTSDSISPVCRYYSPARVCAVYDANDCVAGVDSHFFSADAGECLNILYGYFGLWGQEYANAFQIALPDKTTGACPGGTIPVYRLWNQRTDSNHRYTTSAVIRAQMLAADYFAEGYGADGVVMCAIQ